MRSLLSCPSVSAMLENPNPSRGAWSMQEEVGKIEDELESSFGTVLWFHYLFGLHIGVLLMLVIVVLCFAIPDDFW